MIETLETRTLFAVVLTAPVVTRTALSPPVRLGGTVAVFRPITGSAASNFPVKYDGPDLNAKGTDVAIEPIDVPQDGNNGDPP